MVYLSTLAIAACGLFSVASAAPASLQTRSVKAPVISTCKPGYFALTFDDGPYEYSYKLATTLKEAGIPATFFVNGDNWVNVASDSVQTPDGEKTYEEVLKHVYDSGHQIASHTYQHKDLSPLSASEIREQMQKNEQVIKAAIGKAPACKCLSLFFFGTCIMQYDKTSHDHNIQTCVLLRVTMMMRLFRSSVN